MTNKYHFIVVDSKSKQPIIDPSTNRAMFSKITTEQEAMKHLMHIQVALNLQCALIVRK